MSDQHIIVIVPEETGTVVCGERGEVIVTTLQGEQGIQGADGADGAAGADGADGLPILTTDAAVATPVAGKIEVIARSNVGKDTLALIDSSGNIEKILPSLALTEHYSFTPWNTSYTNYLCLGFDPGISASVGREIDATNDFTLRKRTGFKSGTSAGTTAKFYDPVATLSIGTDFNVVFRFGISDAVLVTAARMFVGISASISNPTDVDPATLINCFGIGHAIGDTNFYLYHAGSSPQSRISLGTDFPCNITNTDTYQLWIRNDKNYPNRLYWQLERLNTGHTVQGVIQGFSAGVDLPASTTLLSICRMFRGNGSTTAATAFDLMNFNCWRN